jgi:hypothetical protein
MEYSARVKTATNATWHQAADTLVKDGNLLSNLPTGVEHMGFYLSNGAKYYRDVGDHPEYATPEDTDFMSVVLSEIAGERIVAATFEAFKEKNLISDYLLNKRVVDRNGQTQGHHENYMGDVATLHPTERNLGLLAVHLATRSTFVGAGRLANDPQTKRSRYYVTQKMHDLDYAYAAGTTLNHKALVNLRNQPLANGELYARVHVTSGDANMSPWASWMALGTTSIVLRMIEAGEKVGNVALQSNELNYAKAVGADTSLSMLSELADEQRTKVTALNIQERLVARARILEKQGRLSQEESLVLSEWERVLDDLSYNPASTADRVDWIARKHAIERYQANYNLSPNDIRLVGVDLQYDELSKRGIGVNYRTGRFSPWMPTEPAIEDAIRTPPQTTRAVIRGAFVARYAHDKQCSIFEWEDLRRQIGTINKKVTLDPRDTNVAEKLKKVA